MEKDRKIKIVIIKVLISVLLCMVLVILKFVVKEENMIEEIYNYLITDIVFLGGI